MARRRRLVLVLVDGLSADYYESHSDLLPNLRVLAGGGTRVRRLRSAVPATSMPGRATMLTGVGPDVHGVIGNHVLDGDSFRVATPDDVAASTVAEWAGKAGRDVAAVGFAMLRPSCASVFHPPWWVRGFMDGSRFAKIPAERSAEYASNVKDPDGRLPAPMSLGPAMEKEGLVRGLAWDAWMMRATAALMCSDDAPDLALVEIAMTDTIQHQFGYASPEAHWSLAHADELVGGLVRSLQDAGRLDDTVLAVVSDHGHAPMHTALYPDRILPGMVWESEGATLHVLADGAARGQATARLAAHGAVAIASDHVPEPHRERVATYAAPEGHSFEASPPGAAPDAISGRPKYASTHGLMPGAPADDRFCVIAGPGIRRHTIDTAAADQLAPTLSAILGVDAPAGTGTPFRTV
ncbi:MAG: alkaline phosphatase family protein [Alphaproteobacteria bacterium]|nr:alkaline phosphatase family protein [Alphaproteobacteria bacterium]